MSSGLLKKLKDEDVSLTDGITQKEGAGWVKKDYFIYWTMEGRKTLFETGMIVVVDNDRAEYSYIEAFEKKYDVVLPNNDLYFETVMDKLEAHRVEFPSAKREW